MTVDALPLRRVVTPVRKALRSDFVRHGALVFCAAMAGNVFNYLFNFALSRRLGVEGFATLSSLVSFLMILSIPTSVITLIVVKYAAVYHAGGDAQRIRRLSIVLLRWTGVAAIVALALGLAVRGEVASFLHIPNDAALVVSFAIVALGLITPSVRGILQGEQDFGRYSISAVLETFLKFIFAVALVYSGYGVVGAMAGWVVGTLCSLAFTVWAVFLKHGTVADSTVRLALDLRRLAQTTLGVGLATGFLTFISFMDVLLVKHYFDAQQAGLYAAVNLTGKIVLFIVGFVPAIVLPKAVAKAQNDESATPLLLQAATVTLVLSGIVLAVFAAMPAEILKLIAGSAFAGGAPYVLQYDVAMGLLAIVTLVVNYKIGIHRFDFLYPLGAVLVLEVAAIAMFHRSLSEIVHILLAGNALAVAGCSYRILDRGSATMSVQMQSRDEVLERA